MGVIYYAAARKEERKFMSGPLAADYAAYRFQTEMFVPRWTEAEAILSHIYDGPRHSDS